jgi:glycosyltransferase involved in cell wall biosynthesis
MQVLKDDGFVLEIVGTGDQEQAVRRMIENKRLARWITMTGYVPKDCLAERYHSSDIFVLPSISESFGQVLLEAMSCGLPIVASRVGGIPETVEDGVNGVLVEPGCSKSLVGAIRRLAALPRLCREIGDRNAQVARSRYNWSAVACRYEKIYSEAIDDEVRSKSQRAK